MKLDLWVTHYLMERFHCSYKAHNVIEKSRCKQLNYKIWHFIRKRRCRLRKKGLQSISGRPHLRSNSSYSSLLHCFRFFICLPNFFVPSNNEYSIKVSSYYFSNGYVFLEFCPSLTTLFLHYHVSVILVMTSSSMYLYEILHLSLIMHLHSKSICLYFLEEFWDSISLHSLGWYWTHYIGWLQTRSCVFTLSSTACTTTPDRVVWHRVLLFS